ncbi:SDR family NAD(P)-dependent oxidoreductase [Microbacterium karelineae]|uniref:SDR family NAD(P)-dependent oxidoreductase n=1 Tax=Microbacterium karelineae TaxID=2654283 RepID=UPI0012EA2682|nr:SDR family oxidoreductase [Microbacterium karelineae]
MPDPLRLDGRRALVTGAGRGLGAEIARTLVKLGAEVYGTARTRDAADEIGKRRGTTGIVLDLADTSAFEPLASQLDVDLLVNNAGVNIPRRATDVSAIDWDTVLDTNLRGTFLLTRAFGRRWIAEGTAAAVVSVTSQAGVVAVADRAAYGASKAGLDQVTKVLALEWGPHRIRVNAVAPTFVRTDMTESTLADPVRAARLLDRIPLGRFGEADDVAWPVAFLLSDAAGLVTGHTLRVDGGYTAC